jgi:5-methylcytosine-specific restriction endonuclease McrA
MITRKMAYPVNMEKLLTRDEFRDRVYARDKHKCVFCGVPATEAHHILDRKCYPDGGYYLNNGASVCNPCHFYARTQLTLSKWFVKNVGLLCQSCLLVLMKP